MRERRAAFQAPEEQVQPYTQPATPQGHPVASGDPKPTGTPTFLGLALRKLPQELAVLLLQAGQAAVQGSLSALGLPQPLLRVLGDGDSRVRATPEGQ